MATHRPDHLQWETALVDGRPAAYGVAGEGPALVFLHGWGLNSRAYKRALSRLVRQGVRVYAPAMPGFGGTAALPGDSMSIAGYGRWVHGFLDAVGVTERVTLVGHSFGGGVAIATASQAPERIRQLVVVNSIGGSAWTEDKGVLRTMADRPIWDWGLHLQADIWPVRQARRVLPVIVQDGVPNLLRRPGSLWRAGRLAARANLETELEQLKRRRVPVVVLWGTGDKVIPAACLASLRSALGDPTVFTVPGNHSWLIADPDGFAEVMTNVLGSVGEPGDGPKPGAVAGAA
jgi:pimeloyl-ACP methyl ester carboxylesterase